MDNTNKLLEYNHLTMNKSTAIAHPNIAFIKYWGNRDQAQRIPVNGSISMNLAALETRTSLVIDPELKADRLTINGEEQSGPALKRVQQFMTLIRQMSGREEFTIIESTNSFPSSAGIASSAAAFAALAVAGTHAYGLSLPEKEMSRLARRGSGSACRSIPAGFVEWLPGTTDQDSFAQTIAPVEHWDLWDCVAIVEAGSKHTGSTAGHQIADSSPLQSARVADSHRRLDICREAIQRKDFEMLAEIIELDSNIMHAVMMTSTPNLIYWQPASVMLMHEVSQLRYQGVAAAYTLDAGPNVHVICTAESAQIVKKHLENLPGVLQVLLSPAGGAARLLQNN